MRRNTSDAGALWRVRLVVGCIAALGTASYGQGQSPSSTLASSTTDRPQISGMLSVDEAVARALQESLAVQGARLAADVAHDESRVTRAMNRPQLSANTYLASGTMPNIVGSSPGVMPANAINVPGRSYYADQNLTLMLPLYTGGRKTNSIKAASGREEAVRAGIGAVEAETAFRVRSSYYRALLATEMAKVADARIDAAMALVALMRAQFEVGRGIQASVARGEAELADARRMRAVAQNDLAKVRLELLRAMGVRLDSEVVLSSALALVPLADTLDANLSEAARIRPELRAMRARLDGAKAETAVAGSARKPQIYGAVMADAFAPDDRGKYAGGTVGVVMSIPLFDGGQRAAEVGKARTMERQLEAELKDAELQVALEVRQARLDVETAGENYRAAEAVVRSSEAAYDVVVLRVENQKAILVEQVDALAVLTQARTNLAQALFDHSIAVAQVARAIGRF